MKIECLCGAELKVSEASSGLAMRIEPHICRGWVAWGERLEKSLAEVNDLHQGV